MRKLHCLPVSTLLLISGALLAQTAAVSGKITDITGTSIPNATIRVKSNRSAAGTSADGQGTFTLRLAPSAELIVSSIGYDTKEIKIGSSTSLTIVLNTDTRSLESFLEGSSFPDTNNTEIAQKGKAVIGARQIKFRSIDQLKKSIDDYNAS